MSHFDERSVASFPKYKRCWMHMASILQYEAKEMDLSEEQADNPLPDAKSEMAESQMVQLPILHAHKSFDFDHHNRDSSALLDELESLMNELCVDDTHASSWKGKKRDIFSNQLNSNFYYCKECHTYFQSSKVHSIHMFEMHAKFFNENSFECFACDKIFTTSKARENHMFGKHDMSRSAIKMMLRGARARYVPEQKERQIRKRQRKKDRNGAGEGANDQRGDAASLNFTENHDSTVEKKNDEPHFLATDDQMHDEDDHGILLPSEDIHFGMNQPLGFIRKKPRHSNKGNDKGR